MEFDITEQIEKTINATIKGPRGVQIANIYRKYFNIVNFVIVYAVGMLFYSVLLGFNFFIAIIATILWTYIMTVGPLGYIWGFKPKPVKKAKKKVIKIET